MRRLDEGDFRSATQVVAEEFGLGWLESKAAEAKEGQTPAHPVPSAWAEAVDLLHNHEQTGQLFTTGRTIWLATLGAYLSAARQLPNYPSAIPYRLRNETEFAKAEYEVFVAAWWAQTGHVVEFIPRQPDQRTPEMRVIAGKAEILIECKSRDRYIQPKTPSDGGFWSALQFALVDLREEKEIGGGLELFVFVPGERDLTAVPEIVSEVRSKLRTGFRGKWAGRQAGYFVRDLKCPDEGFILFLPSNQNPAVMAATVGVNDQGQRYPKDPMRVACFAIDSHKLSAVGYSFDDARRQIRPGALGVIYINLDVSGLDSTRAELYADLVADSLATRFAPTINTRVAAIVVTTEPQIICNREGDRERVILSRHARIKRNPHRPLPDGLSIPGE